MVSLLPVSGGPRRYEAPSLKEPLEKLRVRTQFDSLPSSHNARLSTTRFPREVSYAFEYNLEIKILFTPRCPFLPDIFDSQSPLEISVSFLLLGG